MTIQIPLQQAALQHSQTLPNAVKSSLQLLVNSQNFDTAAALDLLTTLAAISPTCKAKLGNISQADPKTIKTICQQLLQPNIMLAIEADMQTKMAAAKQQTMQAQADWAQAIDAALQQTRTDQTAITAPKQTNIQPVPSKQRQAAIDENAYVANAFIEARRDKALYGDLGPIGHFLELALHMGVVVPLDEEFYARGFEFKPPESNRFEEHMRNMHGGKDIIANDPLPRSFKP